MPPPKVLLAYFNPILFGFFITGAARWGFAFIIVVKAANNLNIKASVTITNLELRFCEINAMKNKV